MHQVSKNPPRNGYLAYSAVTPEPRSAVSSTGRAGRQSNSSPRWGLCRNNPRPPPPKEGNEGPHFPKRKRSKKKNECKYYENFEAQSELSQSSVRAQSELQSELSRSSRFTTVSLNRMKKKINLERRIFFVRAHDAQIP